MAITTLPAAADRAPRPAAAPTPGDGTGTGTATATPPGAEPVAEPGAGAPAPRPAGRAGERAGLTPAQVAELGAAFEELRRQVLQSRGSADAAYLNRVVVAQRLLEVSGRAALLVSIFPPAWAAGTALLSLAKIVENMELGHNILHGQWDWMRDPRYSSATWEWDLVIPADGWKHTHNDVHHTWTNVVGKDRDVGYTVLRMSPDQPWRLRHLAQPLTAVVLASAFEWGIALYDLELDEMRAGRKPVRTVLGQVGTMLRKAGRQAAKDYVLWPLLSGPSAVPAAVGGLVANVVRNVWTNTVIVCGHFPEEAQMFAPEDVEGETRDEWYLRQLLGSANISGGPLLHVLTGNLSHQIEHHLYPDLPSNRYADLAVQVRALCERYGLPYHTGSLARQYASTWHRLLRLSLPPLPGRGAAGTGAGTGEDGGEATGGPADADVLPALGGPAPAEV